MLKLEEGRIKIAVPNKGRLKEPSLELLKEAGYSFRVRDRLLYATCKNANLQIIFVRAENVPLLVDKGVIEIGITGSDLVIEKKAQTKTLISLNYGRCRLCIAVMESFKGKDVAALEGKTIATSFPNITKKFFKSKGINVNIIEMDGALEIMVGLKLADAIVDIVETGDTLRDNKLMVFGEIGNYESVLIVNKEHENNPDIQRIRRRLEGVLIAKKYSLLEYNIKNEFLKEAEKITPGYESPTISNLDEAGWVAVKVMVEKSKVVESMDKLEAIGAVAILETEIKNCRL